MVGGTKDGTIGFEMSKEQGEVSRTAKGGGGLGEGK